MRLTSFILALIALFLLTTAATLSHASPSAAAPSNQVSVKSFGAVGNGVHDDTAAIEAALATLLASIVIGEENQLYFPSGIYLLASTPSYPYGYIPLPPLVNTHFSIVGSGSNTSSLLWTPSNGRLFDLKPHTGGDTGASVQGSQISISGLTIAWSTSYTGDDSSIKVAKIDWYQQTTLKDVQFQGYQAFDSSIKAIRIKGDSSSTLSLNQVTGTNCASFLHVVNLGTVTMNFTTLSNMKKGMKLETTIEEEMNIQIDEMKQMDVPVGVYMKSQSIMNAYITNSQFIVTRNLSKCSHTNEAIIQLAPGLLSVKGCTFNDTTYQSRVHIDATLGAASIVNNTFNSGKSGFFPAGDNTQPIVPSTSLTVTGNTFNGPWSSVKDIAFETKGTANVIVENNVCTGKSELVYQCSNDKAQCVQQNNQGCSTDAAAAVRQHKKRQHKKKQQKIALTV